jgi:hypothetical protein
VDRHVDWSFSTLRHWDEYMSYHPEHDVRPEPLKQAKAPRNSDDYATWTLKLGNLYPYRTNPIIVQSWSLEFKGIIHRV